MPHVVTEPCFGCKYMDCVTDCPVDAFREGEQMLFIDPESCIDCQQCVSLCPVGAIFAEDDVPDEWHGYIELNAEMAPQCPEITEPRTTDPA